MSAACSCPIYSMFPHISCVSAVGLDILDLVTRLMWTHDLIYGGGQRVSEREGFTEVL